MSKVDKRRELLREIDNLKEHLERDNKPFKLLVVECLKFLLIDTAPECKIEAVMHMAQEFACSPEQIRELKKVMNCES